MRKLDPIYEDPIDDKLLNIAEYISPFFKRLGFNANGITTLSLLFGCGSIYNLHYNKFHISSLLYFVSYFFDCMDGNYARRYNMVSKFGDVYDHIKDISIASVISYMLYRKINKYKLQLFACIFIFAFLTSLQLGCQEVIYNKDESPTLSLTSMLCPSDSKRAKKWIRFTRFFGTGAFSTFISIVIFYTRYLI